MGARPRGLLSCLAILPLTVLLTAGCVSRSVPPNPTKPPESGPASSSSAPSSSAPSAPDGAFAVGDCITADSGPDAVECDAPHDYEVTVARALPSDFPRTYPPDLDTIAGPACLDSMRGYVGGPYVEASRLEAAWAWPSDDQWRAGQRWYVCLVRENDPNDDAVRRTGSLRDVLADGLGDFRECMDRGPADPGESRVIPCSRPHRAEAVTPVVVLGKVGDPMPSQKQVVAKARQACQKFVEGYVGGRSGVSFGWTYASPEQWRSGQVTATCFATVSKPVTGSLAAH